MKFSFYKRPITNTTPHQTLNLEQVYEMIIGENFKKNTQGLRAISKNARGGFKAHSFDYVTFSGEFNKRSDNELIQHSGLIALDLDDLTEEEVGRLRKELPQDNQIETGLLFRSPSGNGLKWIIIINLEKATHREWFLALANYVKVTYSIEVDPSGKDISRACFLCYDPDAYLNPAFSKDSSITETPQKTFNPADYLLPGQGQTNVGKISEPDESSKTEATVESDNELLQDVENVVSAIENNRIDITETYSSWRDLGFALADSLGEDGREYYHRVSRFYPEYDSSECDKQFENCLKANGNGITLRTLFYHAKNAGIEITTVENDNVNNFTHPPTIPEAVYGSLSEFFQRIVRVGKTPSEKDVLLIGAIVTLSSSLFKIFGYYDKKKVFPNLYFFLEGLAGSGKSILDHCKHLVMPIHNKLKEQTVQEKAEYRKKMAQYKEEKKEIPDLEPPKQPTEKMLIIPANISAAGMYQLLNYNEGRGLIFETEGDTLANTFKNLDFGNFSDGFRKGFHHETIQSYRKTDNELIEVENPQISTILSGTPRQVLNLIPDAENGLFSRFVYLSLPMKQGWKNVFDISCSESLDDYFLDLGKVFFQYYQSLLRNEEVKFSLTHIQGDKLNEHFTKKHDQYACLYGDNFIAAVRRMGLITFRMAMIFSTIRKLERGSGFSEIICTDTDFENAIGISDILIEHAAYVYKGLTDTPMVQKRETLKQKFYRMLPQEFGRQDFIVLAESIKLNVKTAEKYIKNFKDVSMLQHYGHNKYLKFS